MTDLLQMRNNLIQNFYVIGVPIEEIIDISSLKTKEKSFDIFVDKSTNFIPKIISKFPPIENKFNKIIDELVVTHCFPNKLYVKEGKKYSDYKYHFEFELDNQIYNFIDKNKSIYSKMYFTCLKFYESIKDYKKLKDNIFDKLNDDKHNNNDVYKINTEGRITLGGSPIYYIPKVICFASLLPFPDELYKILINVYDLYRYQSIKYNKNNTIYCPMEKLIEQIIMRLPLPISKNNDIILNFNIEPANNKNFEINKSILSYPKIIFESYDLDDYYLNIYYNLPMIAMIDIFHHFTEENIIKIFKNIIFENPILFFCDDKQLLSNVIEGFLNILSPFKYILPYITILPSKFFGLIHSQDKFIFGINQKYSDKFFIENEININKNIIIVSFIKGNMNLTKIDEISKKNNGEKNKKIYISHNLEEFEQNFPTNLNDIDLPIKQKEKLLSKLKTYLNIVKNNLKKDKIDNKFNSKIRHIFHKFFINILSGYTEYLKKCPNHDYFGDNIRHKYNGKNGLIKYIKEIFDYDKFISNYPKDTQMFYKAFFNTELFFNFIRGVIYPDNEIDSLRHKNFDFMTFLKKNKDLREDDNYKEQYERYKNPIEHKKNFGKKNMNIIISDKYYFIDDEKKILIDENNRKTALFKYSQLIEIDKNEDEKGNNNISQTFFSIKYFLFPKLLFDNKFFNINYNFQFYKHYIDLPNDNFIIELNKSLSEKNDKDNKYCTVIYPNAPNNLKKSNTNFFGQSSSLSVNHNISLQNISFELYIHNYIEFNWLLLLSCSLWYCNSNKEIEIRINNIFDVLEKLEYIEEQVLYFIFFSLYKYSNTSQFIRIFELLYRFIGSFTYYDLLLLFKKLDIMKKNENNFDIVFKNSKSLNSDKDNKIITQKRTFLDVTKFISNIQPNNKIKEEILFYTEQKCDKCGEKIEMKNSELSDMLNRKIDESKNSELPDMLNRKKDESKNSFIYKCKICGEYNHDIIINYNLFLSNIKENKNEIIKHGSFNLISPHLLYQNLKKYVINIKDNNINIDHIFSNKNINLLNFIFYFSLNNLPFDFLIPYENNMNNNISDREYFYNNYEINIKEPKLKSKFSVTNSNISLNGIKK